MTAQTLVLSYVRTPAHFEALWFASIANTILWWTFVKALGRTLMGLMGARASPTSNAFISPAPCRFCTYLQEGIPTH